eukprot:6197181-Pleurochrysis_carterae.AAC.1
MTNSKISFWSSEKLAFDQNTHVRFGATRAQRERERGGVSGEEKCSVKKLLTILRAITPGQLTAK